VLVYGRKEWLIHPPHASEYSIDPSQDWWPTPRVRTTKHLRCEQHAGDVLYVPDMWGHAVLNTRETIGYAMEVESPIGQFNTD
jgi:ribosomal protein L16 Arg81 hydroxylase